MHPPQVTDQDESENLNLHILEHRIFCLINLEEAEKGNHYTETQPRAALGIKQMSASSWFATQCVIKRVVSPKHGLSFSIGDFVRNLVDSWYLVSSRGAP